MLVRRVVLLAVACGLVATTLAPEGGAQGPRPEPAFAQGVAPSRELPPAAHEPLRDTSWVAVIVGSALGVASYVAPLAIAADQDFAGGSDWFVAPIVGPWGYLAARDYGCGARDEAAETVCTFAETLLVTVVVADGFLQLASQAVILGGIFLGERRTEPANVTLRPVALPAPGGGLVPGIAGSF